MAGRPRYKPTFAERERVKVLRADGWSQERIARAVGIGVDTLLKYFGDEMRRGAVLKRAEVILLLYEKARSGNVAAQKHLERITRRNQRLAKRSPAQAVRIKISGISM